MGRELAASFARGMRLGDRLFVCDPVYFGGTVDRSMGSETLVADIVAGGGDAVHVPVRADCGAAMVQEAAPGDRILILGARDDTPVSYTHLDVYKRQRRRLGERLAHAHGLAALTRKDECAHDLAPSRRPR